MHRESIPEFSKVVLLVLLEKFKFSRINLKTGYNGGIRHLYVTSCGITSLTHSTALFPYKNKAWDRLEALLHRQTSQGFSKSVARSDGLAIAPTSC